MVIDTTVTCLATGNILHEEWDNVGGTSISDIPLQEIPTSTSYVTSFEGTLNIGDNYASRIRGYICPPQTGNYTFWIATDDAGELWLSTDDNPANKTRVANVGGWTNFREWGKYTSQQSATITLQAGKKYYIEALQKEGDGGDNLSVQWKLPDGTMETPIAGSHLSPYTAIQTDQTITFASLAPKTNSDTAFTVSATASSGLAVSFRIVSGPATISDNTVTLTGEGTVTIEAFQAGNPDYNAATPVTQSFTVSSATTCSATGTILREEWDNVSGNNISDFSFQTTPTSTSYVTSFEGPVNIGDNYASRIRGYICPPQTGNYTFSIAADDAAELYLSVDDSPNNKVRIANLIGWTDYHEWEKFTSQKSVFITLEAGKKYYIEALQKEDTGGDNLSVQCQLPDGSMETPIAGSHLSPYISQQLSISSLFNAKSSSLINVINATDSSLTTVKTGLFVYPNPVSQQTNVEFTLAESGQTDIYLYNTKGQLITKLFTEVTEANVKTRFILNAEALLSGSYIIRLLSGKNMLTKKIIVVK